MTSPRLTLSVQSVQKVQDVGMDDEGTDTKWRYVLHDPALKRKKVTISTDERLPLVAGDAVTVVLEGARQSTLETPGGRRKGAR